MNAIVHTDNPDWPWCFARDAVFALHGFDAAFSCDLRGDCGRLFARVHWSHLHIFAGYHFDGCTCAPDFCRALPGCAVHDALLQMHAADPDAFPEQLAHDQMLYTHRVHRFNLARVYHWAVSSRLRRFYKLWKQSS